MLTFVGYNADYDLFELDIFEICLSTLIVSQTRITDNIKIVIVAIILSLDTVMLKSVACGATSMISLTSVHEGSIL